MISPLVRRRIQAAGLLPLIEDRSRSLALLGAEARLLVARADLIALGAAADLVRRNECGTLAYLLAPGTCTSDWITVAEPADLVRAVAAVRLLGPPGVRIAVDCDSVGMKIAIVALGFGASDLVGTILPEARHEVDREIERLGYEPALLDAPAAEPVAATSSVAEAP